MHDFFELIVNPVFYPKLVWLVVILVLMCVDMVTGFSQAVINNDLASHKMSQGILKKFCLILVLISSVPVLSLLGSEVGLPALIVVYISETINELLSIAENLHKMNVDISFLDPIFKLLRSHVDEEKDEETIKEDDTNVN